MADVETVFLKTFILTFDAALDEELIKKNIAHGKKKLSILS